MEKHFYIEYSEEISEGDFLRLKTYLDKEVGGQFNHIDDWADFASFKKEGFIRTNKKNEGDRIGWCIDNNSQGIEKEYTAKEIKLLMLPEEKLEDRDFIFWLKGYLEGAISISKDIILKNIPY